MLDLAKCFEVIPHDILAQEALAVGFPLPLLRLSLAACRLPRTLAVNGNYSSFVNAQRGITAGSGTATTELRVLLLRLLDRVSKRFPQLDLNVYVDDMSVEATGSERSVVADVSAAGEMLCSGLILLRLNLSAGKCKCCASTAALGQQLAGRLKEFGIVFASRVKSLGVGMAAGAKRNVQVQRSRFQAFKARLRKFGQLLRSRVSAARLIRTGGAASFTYGDDVTGVSSTTLLARRRLVAAAIAPPTCGRDLDLALLLADGSDRQRTDPSFDAHAIPIGRWAEAVYMGWCPLPLLRSSLARARVKLLSCPRPWSVVHGPAAATAASAHRIGWTVHDATTFSTDLGRTLDLLIDPPVVVKREVYASVARLRNVAIAANHPHLLSLTPPSVDLDEASPRRPIAPSIDIAPIRKLLSFAARSAEWTAGHQAALWSAIVNTQWPQARLRAANLAERDDCQLCAAAQIPHAAARPEALLAEPPRGTALHRLTACRPTLEGLAHSFPNLASGFMRIRNCLRNQLGMPPDEPLRLAVAAESGDTLPSPNDTSRQHHANKDTTHLWGPPSANVESWRNEVRDKSRRETIAKSAIDAAWASACRAAAATRAIIPLPIIAPPAIPSDGTFHWHDGVPTSLMLATFYTDGSRIDDDYVNCKRFGWAFVAVDSIGRRLGAASGVPPPWIESITGAEAWALLMAVRSAAPGASFKTDSLNCADTIRKGKAWALAPTRPLARVWRDLFSTFDDPSDAESVVWMLAHSSSSDVGVLCLGNGTKLTDLDRDSNHAADKLAKSAALAYRVPVAVRTEIAAVHSVTYTMAQYLGRATFAANHHHLPPHRDSAPTPAHARTPAPPTPLRERCPPASARPPALGGHVLFPCGSAWSCRICWATSRSWATLAPMKCTGPAVSRWAEREQLLRESGNPTGPRHNRIMTDGVIWCARCGQYATCFAVGLAKPCPGRPTSDGTRACRNHLANFVHPRSKMPLRQPHFPEPGVARRLLTDPDGLIAWGARSNHAGFPQQKAPSLLRLTRDLPRSSGTSVSRRPPSDAPTTLLLPFVRHVRRRISGKQPPSSACTLVSTATCQNDRSTAPHLVCASAGMGQLKVDDGIGTQSAAASVAHVHGDSASSDGNPSSKNVSGFGSCSNASEPPRRIVNWPPSPPRFPGRKRPHAETLRASLLGDLAHQAHCRSRAVAGASNSAG